MVHELVRYVKSVNMHGEKIKVTSHCVTTAYSIHYSNMYTFVA